MGSLLLAAAFFVAIHLGISGTPLRDKLVRRIGEGPYTGVFSLASFAGMGCLIASYGSARVGASLLWFAPGWLVLAGAPLMAVAVLAVVLGLTTPSPTLAQVDAMALARPEPAQGVLRITRHPFLMGTSLFAVFHAVVNGDSASLVLFGALLLVCLAGAPSIDAKRARKHGEVWARFADKTSIVPFAAIARGKNQLVLGEIAWWQWVAALGAYAALVWAHPRLFGAWAIPGLG
ncbi:MAG: NnrU family protein [Myxococcota bacterium]